MKAVIVTGDRHAERPTWSGIVERGLATACGDSYLLIITGGALGIDAMAESLAWDRPQYDSVAVPAQWKRHGKGAGPRRNTAMLTILGILQEHGYEVSVLAFHDGLIESKGTRDMVNQAVRAGIETWLYTAYNDPKRITEVLT